jgi:hypothetical protein
MRGRGGSVEGGVRSRRQLGLGLPVNGVEDVANLFDGG